MQKRVLVRDCMSKSLKTVKYGSTVSEAVREMDRHKVSSLIVVKEKKPIGIMTRSDILFRVVGAGISPSEEAVQNFMSSPVISIDEDATAEEASAEMKLLAIKRILVTRGGKPSGIVIIDDLARKVVAESRQRLDTWANRVFDAWNAF